MNNYFWFLAGLLAGFVAALVVFPLVRGTAASLSNRFVRMGASALAVVAFGAVAMILYRALGSPELLADDAGTRAWTHPPVGAAGGGGVLPAEASEVDVWLVRATEYRRQREYAAARDAYAKVVQLNGMNADTWADYADVLASASGGSLKGDAAAAIDKALSLDGSHAKALWLRASLAHQEERYGDALANWERLRAVLPAGSSDERIVDANVAEARALVVGSSQARAATALAKPANARPGEAATAAGAEVNGTVSIDSKLAGRVPGGATLFIYAKAANSPGPPLAVLRQTAGAWPVAFRLDDTLAMIPTRRLSQFDAVVVEARISRSGQAAPAAGDFYVTSGVLHPRERKPLQLVISREVS